MASHDFVPLSGPQLPPPHEKPMLPIVGSAWRR